MLFRRRNEILRSNKFTLASFYRRILSFIVDALILAVVYFLSEVLLQYIGLNVTSINVTGFTHIEFESENLGTTAKFLINCFLIIIPTLYFTLVTFFFNGQTFGKKLFKIRVVSLYHDRVGFWHCLERSLGYVASTLEFGLGFIQAIWNKNRMTLHDKIAETVVIDSRYNNNK